MNELIRENSLAETVNAVNAAYFFGDLPAQTQREAAAQFIAGRHGQKHAYAGTFGLFDNELKDGIVLFTGERTRAAAARHIAGEEACRALKLLGAKSPAATAALEGAMAGLMRCVGPAAPQDPRDPHDRRLFWNWDYRGGTYCCGRCSVALWRNIAAGNFDRPQTRLSRGLKALHESRTDAGGWGRFPFWYTASALLEMPDTPAVLAEIRHAAPRCEAALKRQSSGPYERVRQEVARRLLAGV